MATMIATGQQRDRRPSRAYAAYVVAVLGGISFLNAMDTSVLSGVISAVEPDLHISDAQYGLLATAFVAVNALAMVPLGYLSDVRRRTRIIGIGIAIWSLATLATGATRTFPQILGARAVLGVGEASAMPAGTSLLGDWYSRRSRGRAMGFVQGAYSVGIGVGVIAGSAIALHLGWRFAFYLAAAPGLVLAVLALAMREPLRGAAEPSGVTSRESRDAGPGGFHRLLRIPTFTAATVTYTLYLFAMAGVFQFVPLYLSRRFHLDIASAGALAGMPIVAAAVLIPAGGWLVDHLSGRSPRRQFQVAAGSLAAGAAATAAAFLAGSVTAFESAWSLAAVASAITAPALLTVNQNVVLPSLRASAAGTFQLCANLVGMGLGPLALGLASAWLGDLRAGFLGLVPTALVLAAGIAAAAAGGVNRDVAAMEAEWADRAAEAA